MRDDLVLSGHWMVVARSEDIGSTPVRTYLLGTQIVLWRSSTGLHAFHDLCIHRGTALSLGRVEADTLVCPYHGWRYDGGGQCVFIPAQPDLPIPTKAKAVHYPCQEAYGLVWVCLGDPSVVLPTFAEYGGDFHTVICGPYHVQAEAPRVVENFLDVSHLMWVHEGYLGVPEHATIPDYHVHKRDHSLITDPIGIFQPDPDGRGHGVANEYVYEVLGPLTARFRKTDAGSDDVFAMMLHATPNRPCETTAYALLSRNYAHNTPDRDFRDFQDKIFSQDETILLSQRPELLPLDLAAELHIKSDRLAIAYRRWLAELGVTAGVV